MIDLRRRSFLFGATAAALAVPARTIFLPPKPALIPPPWWVDNNPMHANCRCSLDWVDEYTRIIAQISGIPARMLNGEAT